MNVLTLQLVPEPVSSLKKGKILYRRYLLLKISLDKKLKTISLQIGLCKD